MACTLSNMCAKNLSKRTVLLQLIIKNVVTCFLEHSVEWCGPDGEFFLMIHLFVSTEYTNVTDRHTDTARRHRPHLRIA